MKTKAKTTPELIPALFDSFVDAIRPFKGAKDTPENRRAGCLLIQSYAGQLQLLDLSLSQQQARAQLLQVYKSI